VKQSLSLLFVVALVGCSDSDTPNAIEPKSSSTNPQTPAPQASPEPSTIGIDSLDGLPKTIRSRQPVSVQLKAHPSTDKKLVSYDVSLSVDGNVFASVARGEIHDGNSTISFTSPRGDQKVFVKFMVSDSSEANTSQTFSFFTDNIPPTISGFTINGGAPNTSDQTISVLVEMKDSPDEISVAILEADPVTHQCISPDANEWKTWKGPDEPFQVIFNPTKEFCIWAKDAAGNMSHTSLNSSHSPAAVSFGTGTPLRTTDDECDDSALDPDSSD
jgi:hypothetical protein